MATSPHAFYSLWKEANIREKLFELLSKEDICAVRVANSACCNLVTKRLFLRVHLTFTANTFTNPFRVQALSRIGHHIEHLTFSFAHSDATFLPPLLHPQTGREISFIYAPHTSMASVLARPKYTNSEFEEIVNQQYPPLFHAASNVPSFINAMKHIPNMRHLTIRTPGQDPKERYRRDVVDYALISLRIALERTPLKKLSKLSLSAVHPSAFNYLRHVPGFGASPSAPRRWRQIRKLYISVESWDFYGPSPGLDHLKIIDDFIRNFAPQLEKFAFAWLGRRGPCPLALSGDPLFAPSRDTKKLFNEVTGPMSPLPARPARKPLVMPKLRFMSVRNATMNAPQLSKLVAAHKDTVREFDLENVVLTDGGSLEEAFAPLSDGGSDAWSRHSMGGSEQSFRPPTARSVTGSGVASSHETEQLPTSSAAADAASKELFHVDLEGMVFGGINDVDALEVGVEEWARGVTAAAAQQASTVGMMTEASEVKGEDDGGLASDIEAAKEASMAFSTRLKKRRIRKKREQRSEHRSGSKSEHRRDKHSRSDETSDRHHSRSRHQHSRGDDTSNRHPSRDRDRERDRSHSSRRHRHHRHHSEEIPSMPSMPSMPEVIGTDDEALFNNIKASKEESITPPLLLDPFPLPALLQPTVYDPSATAGPLLPTVSEKESARGHDGLSAVQRVIEADLLAEAEEAALRSSALKRAKEAVLAKLSREFCKRRTGSGAPAHTKDSAAVVAGLSNLNLGAGGGYGYGYGMHSAANGGGNSMGYRIREGLFGRSMANVNAMSSSMGTVMADRRGVESQSTLVPLIFSRS
ncbi:hypothetical protein B0T19DRAFT_356669 [Cercophora scortea]|uniref:Uncharacterized protein n=1 Tax=Cercophora scortea TaxID=314031 RepID=A0AAE0MDK5_9PEZI|nr:hypothetical protein B0T19DRAFT_356669 [Cercophora scortea]